MHCMYGIAIDHTIINCKWTGSLQDMWVMRNSDDGRDHKLIVAKIALNQRNAQIGMTRNKLPDISRLMDTRINEKFSITLRNRFSILQDETAVTIDNFSTVMMESAKETIGCTKTCKSEWITPDTWRIIEKRRQLKKKALDSKSHSLKERAVTQNIVKNKQVKTSSRRLYIERLATEAEAAAERRDMKTIIQIIWKLRGDRG